MKSTTNIAIFACNIGGFGLIFIILQPTEILNKHKQKIKKKSKNENWTESLWPMLKAGNEG